MTVQTFVSSDRQFQVTVHSCDRKITRVVLFHDFEIIDVIDRADIVRPESDTSEFIATNTY